MTKQPYDQLNRRGCPACAEGLEPASLRSVHVRLPAFDGPRSGP